MDSNNDFLWNTFDFCRTVQGFELPFKPSDLLLHSRKPNLVLGYSGAHPSKQVRDGDPVDPVLLRYCSQQTISLLHLLLPLLSCGNQTTLGRPGC